MLSGIANARDSLQVAVADVALIGANFGHLKPPDRLAGWRGQVRQSLASLPVTSTLVTMLVVTPVIRCILSHCRSLRT